MSILIDVVLIVVGYALFGAIHSILASNWAKIELSRRIRGILPYYRLLYNVVSVVSLNLIYEVLPKPDGNLYDLPFPFDLIILIPQFLALIALIYSFFFIDGKEFLGFSQIKRANSGEYKEESLDEESSLRVDGPYKISRHPIYLFSILFLLFRPVMSVFYATTLICFIVYFYVGAYYEEKKLLQKFGDDYLNYMKKVGKIFPKLPIRSN